MNTVSNICFINNTSSANVHITFLQTFHSLGYPVEFIFLSIIAAHWRDRSMAGWHEMSNLERSDSKYGFNCLLSPSSSPYVCANAVCWHRCGDNWSWMEIGDTHVIRFAGNNQLLAAPRVISSHERLGVLAYPNDFQCGTPPICRPRKLLTIGY